MGVALLMVELNRKNKEDAAKKEKEQEEKQQIRDLHERHLATEKARAAAGGRFCDPRLHVGWDLAVPSRNCASGEQLGSSCGAREAQPLGRSAGDPRLHRAGPC